MKVYVYIVECSDGTYYTGSTRNLEKRLYEHYSGEGPSYTRSRLPVKLVFQTEFPSFRDAVRFEKQVKGWNRKKKKALIEGRFELLHMLAECKNETHFSRYLS